MPGRLLAEGILCGGGQGVVNTVKQGAVVQRLLQHLPEAHPQGTGPQARRGWGADEDGGQVDVTGPEPVHEIDAIHPRHREIDDEAACPGEIAVRKELSASLIEARLQAFQLQGELQGLPHGGIIVDEEDGSHYCGHGVA